jgi:pimeloyl-ACP methyl ester carboxylesterase
MTLVSERVGQTFHGGHRLEYTEHGAGDRWVVLLSSRLAPRTTHLQRARSIAASGAHVVTVDLLGHGRSDRPGDPMLYSLSGYAEQVLGLLDHLGADRAVLGGTALGANIALEAAVLAPDRVQGLLVESPLLDNAVGADLVVTAPLLAASRLAPLTVRATRLASRAVPRRLVPFWVGVGLDTLDQQPGAMAATLHGLLFGRQAPPAAERRGIDVPVLVVGHRGDLFHPVADAHLLAEEAPDSRFVEARGPLEWRLRPGRLDALAADFVATCWEVDVARRLADASS